MKEKPKKWIVGIDEVGRGPLAGPVYVCAVAMLASEYKKVRWSGLTDSKKLSVNKREIWHARAREMERESVVHIAIARESARMIDTKGISWCIRNCIIKILKQLDMNPEETLVLLDGGLKAPIEYEFQKTIIKGDSIHKIISLASVVAKVTRDAYMIKMAKIHPNYLWDQNKGYGTKTHIVRLKKHGLTSLHRKSFLGK